MIWQRRSRTFGPPQFPLAGCDGSFFDSPDACGVSTNDPISSTEQIPMPYALRRARFTARVSATRISAPWTRADTFEGSASPYPTKPLQTPDLKTVALNAHRVAAGSENFPMHSTFIPAHFFLCAILSRPAWLTYQRSSR